MSADRKQLAKNVFTKKTEGCVKTTILGKKHHGQGGWGVKNTKTKPTKRIKGLVKNAL